MDPRRRQEIDAASDSNVGVRVAEHSQLGTAHGASDPASRIAAETFASTKAAPAGEPHLPGVQSLLNGSAATWQAVSADLTVDGRGDPAAGAPPRVESEPDALRGALETVLGHRYTILRSLGRGGMGAVYLVRDRQHDRPLAIKVVLPEVAASLGASRDVERFLREIRISAHLSHPHIVALYDSGQAGGLLYYTMPYVPGESLRGRLRRERQLPLQDVVSLTRQVASALDYAHRQGVIHRDVKPENILLHEGEALVADFGIARAAQAQGRDVMPQGAGLVDIPADPIDKNVTGSGTAGPLSSSIDDRLTGTGLAIGTPLYMSPEQAGAEPVDDRSDIYALGCVVYEMLAGEPPFTGANVAAILSRKLSEDVPPLATRREGLPAALDRVIRQALCCEPAGRFASADEFARALTRAASPPVESASEDRVRWRHGARKSSLTATAVAALALGAALATTDRPNATGRTTPAPGIRAIAVLPIEAESSQLLVADDIHARLVNELARISALRVTGGVSAMRYRGSTKSPATVARELNAEGLVESFLMVGRDSLAIQVRIRRGKDGQRLWGREYTTHRRRLEQVQKDVVRDIIAYLQLPLTPEEWRRLTQYRLINPHANAEYQRGRAMSASFDPGRFPKSVAAFEAAIRLDPDDPAPYVALAELYETMVGGGHVGPKVIQPAEGFRRARELAQRALELDPDNAEAHVILGGIRHMWDWDWKGAEHEFALAIRLSPGSAPAHFQYGAYLQSVGLIDSGLVELRRAANLDPLSPIILGQFAWAHIWAGNPDSALYWTRSALDLEPNFNPVHWVRSMAFTAKEQHDSAIAEARRGGGLAVAYAGAGRLRDFERILRRAPGRGGSPLQIARAFPFHGDREAAIRALEMFVEQRRVWAGQIRGDPAYEGLVSDPRYQKLLRRMGLPPRLPAKRRGAEGATGR